MGGLGREPEIRKRPTLLALFALVLGSLSGVAPARAGGPICRVPTDEFTIQDAVDNNACELIQLEAGTFIEVVTIDRNVQIVGRGMNKSIVDAAFTGRAFQLNAPATHVQFKKMTIKQGETETGGSGIESLIDKLTIARVKLAGNQVEINGSPAGTSGAAIYTGGKLVMRNSVVTNNKHLNDAVGDGGGIYIQGSAPKSIITDSVFSNNRAGNGGGIYTLSDLTVRRTTFRKNRLNEDDGMGAGIFKAGGSDLSVFDSTFKENSFAAGDNAGGGIAVTGFGAVANIVRTQFVGNVVNQGGAVLVDAATATINNSTLHKNIAGEGFGGGVRIEDNSIVTIRNSTLSRNEAGDGGGGISITDSSSLDLSNSTLSGNIAVNYGGGIDAYNGPLGSFSNTTFTKNVTDSDGDGLGDGGGFHTDFTDFDVKNVISVKNMDKGPGKTPNCHAFSDDDITSMGGNVFGDITGCEGLFNEPGDAKNKDAKLGSLANNGGPTKTHSLKPSSPAIDRGRPGCPPTDQRGAKRKNCDSGSYEFVKCEGVVVDLVGTSAKDTLKGNGKKNGILGLGGKDRLVGKAKGDGLCGGKGNDRLSGGGGNDGLDGEDGNDTCIGGPGSDTAKACETEKSLALRANHAGVAEIRRDRYLRLEPISQCDGTSNPLVPSTLLMKSPCFALTPRPRRANVRQIRHSLSPGTPLLGLPVSAASAAMIASRASAKPGSHGSELHPVDDELDGQVVAPGLPGLVGLGLKPYLSTRFQ